MTIYYIRSQETAKRNVYRSHQVKQTPLHDLHLELGAKMVPFAGYEMPVHYPTGIISEHLNTRTQASLFDVSHMGQVTIAGENAPVWLETLLPADIVGLKEGAQRYSFLTTETGGILDDLMVYRLQDEYCLVVNAANKNADVAFLKEKASPGIQITLNEDRALLALQGPQAATALESIAPGAAKLGFMQAAQINVAEQPCSVTRSGYTGEDGFEISTDRMFVSELASTLLTLEGVAPAGLGARDTLRLEAGLCLHGNDIGPEFSPIEAGLHWAIPACRRSGGDRAGGFPGAERIQSEIEQGANRTRVGIRPKGKAPVRAHAPLLTPDGMPAGEVTSGGFGPSLSAPIAMAYVPASLAKSGGALEAQVRNKTLSVTVCGLPFVPHRYHRKP